ncbi:hypothetical protein MCOR27_006576 [Pyricularia oryzae]|uniref:S1 motif domain-containing protein n=3 Tax=Pyricularia TaxID=48558 RepID=A0ABQ8NHB1_PYRGI|nr:uncharacterized protein MGG_05260 [Pyricularia oryzae 70-15]KAH8848198.1 hypothetical protein MCOR01_001583 [Pyricularia oryzae]KAI6297069.1 hypothetical protein MCOR33_006525 [Pyricularia grisea]EHA53010.1 hypothetical protein MGG_05260 [Pyricularia oryzae 70-15]KAH9429864.1 hypothetical protein MCOR02_009594 [Pyricularia oryzae]KAI6257866.1 hypothetical protein MCOR19_005740 [Pyricularia oryzae]
MSSLKRKDAPGSKPAAKPPAGEPPSKRPRSDSASKSKDKADKPASAPAAPVVSKLKEDEPLFPRGGGSVLTPLEHKQIKVQASKDVLFEQESGKSKGKEDRAPKKLKGKKSKTQLKELAKNADSVKIESLNFKRLVKGSLVLGQISAISALEVEISLPNNVTGHVKATSISTQLTKKLQDAMDVDQEEEDDDSEIDLTSILSVGQYVRAYVVSTMEEPSTAGAKGKRRIELSLQPELANTGLSSADVVENSTVAGSISSVEDHGYVVDLGIQNLTGFLSKKEVDKGISAAQLEPGCVHLLLVTGVKGKIAQVSTLTKKLSNVQLFPGTAKTINTFLPGTAVDVLVSDISGRGLAGKVMGSLDVTADIIHSGLGPNGVNLEKKYKIGSKVKARVICNFPTSDNLKLGISLLSHLTSLQPRNAKVDGKEVPPLTALPHSSIVEQCTVTKVEPDIGLFVDTGIEGVPGFVHISRVKDGKVDALYEASGPYKTGSVHRGRIVGYNSMDGMYHLSFEKSILERQYLRIEDVPIAEVVNVTIEKMIVKEDGLSGVIVKLADGITGFVPEMHLADIRLQHPEKKFREGLKVKARVLSVDPAKNQLRLTFKKTLVNSEAAPIKDFGEASVGQQVQGTIVKIKPIGAFVQFYGTLRGFLPIGEMSESFIRDPNEHFRTGQVVNVHVISVDPERRRLVVSCKDPAAFGVEKQMALQKLKVGDLVSGSVTEKSEDNVFLELKDSSLKAVLRAHHLTDKSPSKNQSALSKIRVGQTLEDLVVLEKDEGRRSIVLSLKPSLVKASQNGQFLTTLADAKVGKLVQGFVRNITPTAVFVQFGGNLTALLPKSMISTQNQALEDFGLRLHQAIEVKVHSVEDKRLVVSMPDAEAPKDTKPRHEAKPVSNAVDASITSTDDISVGTVTKARIASIKKTQLNVALADNVQGRVDISEVFDSWDEITNAKDPLSKFTQNQIIDVRVIGVHDARNYRFLPFSHRTANSVLELTAKPSSVRAKGQYKPLAMADVKAGSSWLTFVNNNEDKWLWVNLSPAVRGRIRSSEVSDDSSHGKDLRQNFPVGTALRARVLAVDADNGKLDLSARSARPNEHMKWEELEKDTVMHARVTKVNDRQVFFQISDSVAAPVQIIDLNDDYDHANPLKYSKNDIVRVSVVSIDKNHKKLRLSARESRVLSSELPVKDKEITSVSQIEQGTILRGFVKNVSDKGLFVTLGGDVTALVRISDLSDAFLKDWKEHFQVDQLVKGRVTSVDKTLGHVQMSLKASAVDEDYKPLPGYGDLKEGQVITGKVRKVADFGAFILIDKSANVSGLCHRTEMADKPVKDATKLYREGDSVKAIILSVDAAKKKVSFGLKPSYFEDADSDEDMEDDEDSDDSGAALGFDSDDDDDEDEDDDMDDGDSVVLFTGTGGAESSNDEDEEDDDVSMTDAQAGGAALPGLDAGGFDWSGGNLDADDQDSDASSEEKTKKTKKRRKAEIEVDRTGDLDANGPQTAGDFERLLLGQPNSSALWIAYMAFHMQVSELAKAREVAERAINTINVREETEKLNVWIAYLNLEVAYGTDESLDEVFKRACQYNDDLEVHERLASICIQSGKHDKADELFQAMVKKFGSKSPKVWLNYAHFLYTSAKSPDRGRALLPRAMKSLGSHAHLELASKFAGLEFRCPGGDPERGRTVFEGLLSTYPKRLDLRGQLLDLEVAAGSDKAVVRDVFERGTKAKGLKPKQAKKWFQRWAKWEEANGDAKSREKVSAKAQEWARLAEARKADTSVQDNDAAEDSG